MTSNKKDAYEMFMKETEFLEAGDPAQAALLLERAKVAEPESDCVTFTRRRKGRGG